MDVVIRQKGKCACGCNKPLINLNETRFDHDPPLGIRVINSDGTEYDPPANDPRFIFAMRERCHDTKTNHPRGPHTTIDSTDTRLPTPTASKPSMAASGRRNPRPSQVQGPVDSRSG